MTPAQAIARWPSDVPLAALISAGSSPRARWSVLARPVGTITWHADGSVQTAGDVGSDVPLKGDCPCDLDALWRTCAAEPVGPPSPGWIGHLSYDLGRRLEPRARAGADHPPGAWPIAQWHRCEHAYVHDQQTDRWSVVGDAGALPGLDAPAHAARLMPIPDADAHPRYVRSVRRALEYIRAGDVYQVNLAHRLALDLLGSPLALASRLLSKAGPWFGAVLHDPAADPARTIVSLSPELFLDFDARTGRVVTRPMKGTRPRPGDPDDLRDHPKDRAELDMIIDLMRNDLGRVCEFGSVHVDERRAIEPHGDERSGVWQAVATVSGTARAGVGAGGLLGACFPPGSVTGAPKIRAMQIIDELEGSPRGPYCGCVGALSDAGRMQLNVAIRTAAIVGTCVEYRVGAGIVAESDPEGEWRETLDKARVLLVGAPDDAPTPIVNAARRSLSSPA